MADEEYESGATPELGSKVIVKLNFCDEEGNIVEEQQFFGKIDRINDEEVVIKHPTTGKEVSLPPHFGSYKRPETSEFELSSTGETISDPDYITEWTLRASSGA